MGFCTKEEYSRFLHQCPIFERLLVEDGILLRKYWFSVSDEEQQRRFKSRLDDPMRRWKLSPMDLESITRWEDYSRAKDEMFVHTDIPEAPWYVVESDDKRRARINMIAHLLEHDPVPRREAHAAAPPAPAAVPGVCPPGAGHAGVRARPRRRAGPARHQLTPRAGPGQLTPRPVPRQLTPGPAGQHGVHAPDIVGDLGDPQVDGGAGQGQGGGPGQPVPGLHPDQHGLQRVPHGLVQVLAEAERDPAGRVSACTPGTGGSVTRSTTTSVVIAHSIAVPLTSPSPWAACPSPRHSSAPGTVTGR